MSFISDTAYNFSADIGKEFELKEFWYVRLEARQNQMYGRTNDAVGSGPMKPINTEEIVEWINL